MANLVNIIGVVGSLLSLVGVIIAIAQIRKTLRAAQAAEAAARETMFSISRNLLIADVSTCARLLEEVKVLIRVERHEAALIRVTDLRSQLIQLRQLRIQTTEEPKAEFTKMLTQLSIIRDLLEQKMFQAETEINPVAINSQLSKISDQLNRLLGEEKFAVGRQRNA